MWILNVELQKEDTICHLEWKSETEHNVWEILKELKESVSQHNNFYGIKYESIQSYKISHDTTVSESFTSNNIAHQNLMSVLSHTMEDSETRPNNIQELMTLLSHRGQVPFDQIIREELPSHESDMA